MSKKRFNGLRLRVEGERASHASRVIAERGYTIKHEGRLGDDTGYIIRTVEGPVVNLYDTGSILVSGNGRREFGSVEELRPPGTGMGVLILTSSDDARPELASMLDAWRVPHEHARISDKDWMGTVAAARGRGLHVLIGVAPLPGLRSGSNHAEPEVYFGIGLIVARISRDNFTVICRESVRMPPREHMFGTEIIRYTGRVHEAEEQIRQRLSLAGIVFDAHVPGD